jgi:hypothetical protein
MNEKEDLEAMHQSGGEVKEHLLKQIHDLDRNYKLKSTELLMKSERLLELEQFEADEIKKREVDEKELKAFKKMVAKEIK